MLKHILGTVLSLSLVAAPLAAQAQDAPQPPPPSVVVESPPAPNQVVVNPAQQPAYVNAPQRQTEVTRNNGGVGLIWGGAVVFGVSYGAAAIGAAAASDVCDATGSSFGCLKNRNDLYIPVAGPFLALNDVEGSSTRAAKALLAVDGALQIAGVAMTLTGIVMSALPSRTATTTSAPVAKRKVFVAPFASATSAGLGAMGKF